jgi:hypothetical protein
MGIPPTAPAPLVAQTVQPSIPEPTEHTFSGHRLSILLTVG